MRCLALASLVLVACGGEPPAPGIVLGGFDGVTNGNGTEIGVRLYYTSDPRALTSVSLITWPQLDAVPAELTVEEEGTDLWFHLEPEQPLLPQWYAVVIELWNPDAGVTFVGDHTVLADGRIAFRIYGTSSPRIRSVSWGPNVGASGSSVDVEFSEVLEVPAGSIPIRVTADDVACAWFGGGGGIVSRTSFGCTATTAAVGRLEVIAEMTGPGGGVLAPQTIDLDAPPSGHFAPIE